MITENEIKRRAKAGETYSSMSARSWRRKLRIVKRLKIETYKDYDNRMYRVISEDNVDRCPLCDKYYSWGIMCDTCPVVVSGVRSCLNYMSKYNKVNAAKNYTEFVNAMEELIKMLDGLEETERKILANK